MAGRLTDQQSQVIKVWHKVYDEMRKTWGAIHSADAATKAAKAMAETLAIPMPTMDVPNE